MRKFNPKATRSARSIQAWLILIGLAKNRQTITYGQLGRLMFGRKAAGVLAQILGSIAHLCDANKFPQLNAIVVGQNRGTPGRDIPLKPSEIDRVREKVYQFNWYNIYPPVESDFDAVL